MSEYLAISTDVLEQKTALHTAKEITQQPECWQQTADNINAQNSVRPWLNARLEKPNLRIILTGAGTSAYIGDTLAPYLTKQTKRLVESISTTDIVSSPEEYLLPNVPTLLVSYGRSGDSPESVAAVEIANQVIDDCSHLIVTCNPGGKLAYFAEDASNAKSLLMPKQTLDLSFAMTSSFTSMYVSTLQLFSENDVQLAIAIKTAKEIIETMCTDIKAVSELKNKKQIFLGSGSLHGMAKEASLKYMELTAGQIGCFNESSLGFRHGPKSNVDDSSIVIMLDANDSYVGAYDQDMKKEICIDNIAMKVISLREALPITVKQLDQAWLGLPYIVYCQILSFYKSLNLGLTPDNPCPTGEVNRVVKGVNIYPINQ